jgi:hypothetical protein
MKGNECIFLENQSCKNWQGQVLIDTFGIQNSRVEVKN